MVWQEDRRGPYVWSCGVGDSKTTEELFIKNFEIDQQWMFYILLGNSVRSIISTKAEYFLRKRQCKFKELAVKDWLMRTWMVAVHTSPVPSSLSCFPPISSSWNYWGITLLSFPFRLSFAFQRTFRVEEVAGCNKSPSVLAEHYIGLSWDWSVAGASTLWPMLAHHLCL